MLQHTDFGGGKVVRHKHSVNIYTQYLLFPVVICLSNWKYLENVWHQRNVWHSQRTPRLSRRMHLSTSTNWKRSEKLVTQNFPLSNQNKCLNTPLAVCVRFHCLICFNVHYSFKKPNFLGNICCTKEGSESSIFKCFRIIMLNVSKLITFSLKEYALIICKFYLRGKSHLHPMLDKYGITLLGPLKSIWKHLKAFLMTMGRHRMIVPFRAFSPGLKVKIEVTGLGQVAQLVTALSQYARIAGSILGHGTWKNQSMNASISGTNQCFALSLSPSPSQKSINKKFLKRIHKFLFIPNIEVLLHSQMPLTYTNWMQIL